VPDPGGLDQRLLRVKILRMQKPKQNGGQESYDVDLFLPPQPAKPEEQLAKVAADSVAKVKKSMVRFA
jgi:hypothetical protein